MSELWQSGAILMVGVVVAALWFFLIYKPRRTVEGEGDPTDPVENTPEEEEKS